jgi:hypothetical protein
VLPLGLEPALCARAREEADAARPAMQPVTMPYHVPLPPPTAAAPAGAGGGAPPPPLFASEQVPRGDAHVSLGRYMQATGAHAPVLSGLRETLTAMGSALTPHLRAEPSLRLQLTEKSDAFIGCVPLDAHADAHFESSCTNPQAPLERKLSLTVFLPAAAAAAAAAAAEEEEEGRKEGRNQGAGRREGASEGAREGASRREGPELFYDDSIDCWRTLPQTEETCVVVSLSDRVLRKFARAFSHSPPTTSLSLHFLGGYALSEEEEGEQRRLLPTQGAQPQAQQPQAQQPQAQQPQAQQPQARPQPPTQQPSSQQPQARQQPQPQPRVQPPPAPPAVPIGDGEGAEDSDSDEREGAMDELG